jgi:hypothetical protein
VLIQVLWQEMNMLSSKSCIYCSFDEGDDIQVEFVEDEAEIEALSKENDLYELLARSVGKYRVLI